jgi:ankyrin repeat protein
VAVRPSTVEGAGLGAFALRAFAPGEVIGPYRCTVGPPYAPTPLGQVDRGLSQQYMWSLNESHKCDADAIRLNNPMRYVNSVAAAESCGRQNVEMQPVRGPDSPIAYVAVAAIVAGDELLVDYGEDFFKNKPAMGVRYECRLPPLHLASVRGDANAVRALLSKRAPGPAAAGAAEAEVNQPAPSRLAWTPLFEAAFGGSTAVARLLLEHGAKVGGIADPDGRTPLFIACQSGHVGVAAVLLEHGAGQGLHGRLSNSGHAPLHIACQLGHAAVVAALLSSGASVDLRTAGGAAGINIAAQTGHEGVVALLLERGADVDHPAEHGCTPLYAAAQQGHTGVAALLLGRGASIDVPSEDGASPLFIACQEGAADVAALLVERGAAVERATRTGFTPLLVASRKGHADVITLLLDGGAGVDTPTPGGHTPLLLASYWGNLAAVEALLRAGGDPKVAVGGQNALSVATAGGHREVAAAIRASLS